MQSYYMSKSRVRLDDYICDLNLEVAPGGYSCQPLSAEGFSYMWAGCKATYGIRSGKVCFEVKMLSYNDVTCKDVDSHVARVGWSTDDATLQLGEDKNSFGFGGTGKKSVNRKFANYGRRFEKGDVVGCYLAMENGWVDISYTVNGRFCGSAFKIRWMTDEALFPHILSKNCKLEVNFGQANHPYFSLQPGYKLIDHVPPEFLIPAVRCPSSQNDCEIIMMVGLPGVGKSTWAMNYAKIHPSKKYVILGTDSIIEKMRVQGLHRKNNFSGRWDVLIKQASDCFNTLLKKASNLPRNLVLDQTNVYASARRRKVKQYREKGYTINAMVLVPRDEDMIRRSEQRTLEEGKEVPDSAVLEMKANFSIPHENEGLFDKITFLELQRQEGQELVEQYNREANLKGYQSNKQKGQSRHMNQSERKINRYFSQGPDDHQQERQQQGYQSRFDERHQTPMAPPSSKTYEDESRGTKKRPESSSNYGPPDKYRRSNSPSSYDRQAYSSLQQYSSDFNQNDPYGGGQDQWGSTNKQSGGAVPLKPYVKEEPGLPLARGDTKTPYGNDYSRSGVKSEGYSQYSNVKADPSSYDDAAYPRQGAYQSGQSYGNDPYYSQTTSQTTSARQQPGPPGTDQYGYPVKSEQNTSDSWYSQGNQNYSSGDAPFQQRQNIKPDPYQQQGAYYDSNQQYGVSSKGYGAEPKSENWSGQTPYSQSQQFNRPASQTSSKYGTGNYDSYSDRSSSQQWNESNINQGYEQQDNRQTYSGQQTPNNHRPPSSQYGDYQGNYGYDDRNRDAYGQTATSQVYPKQEFGSEQYQDYNQNQSNLNTSQAYPAAKSNDQGQPNTSMSQGYPSGKSSYPSQPNTSMSQSYSSDKGNYPSQPNTSMGQAYSSGKSGYPSQPNTSTSQGYSTGKSNYSNQSSSIMDQAYSSGKSSYSSQPNTSMGQAYPSGKSSYETKMEPQRWDSQGQYGQSQWDSGLTPPGEQKRGWDQSPKEQLPYQRQQLPPSSRNSERPLQPLRDSRPNADVRSSDRQWTGQGNTSSRFSDTRPSGPAFLPTPPGEKPRSSDRQGPTDRRPQTNERERSPRNGERSRRPRSDDEPRSGKRDESSARRGDREESRRSGDREDLYSRHGGRSASRRSERDESSRHGDRSESSRRGDKEISRRSDRDDSRSRSGDHSRDSGRPRYDRRDDRDRSRGDERRNDSRGSRGDSSDRGRRDQRPPPPKDDRRPKDDRERPNERPEKPMRPTTDSPSLRKSDDPKPTASPSKPTQTTIQKMGLLPLPNQAPLPSVRSPTDKAGLSSVEPTEQSIVDEATSKLSTVDFDKLKQSLVNLRKQNLNLTKEPSSPMNQSGGSDMEIVPEEEMNTNVVHVPSAVAPTPIMPLATRPRRPPPPAARGSLLGPGPNEAVRGTRPRPPRMESAVRPDIRMRARAPGVRPPRDPGSLGILRRPPLRPDGPRPRSKGPGLLGNLPRRPLLETPNTLLDVHDAAEELEEIGHNLEEFNRTESGLLRPPRPLRPRMLRPRLRGPRPGGMRPLLRPGMRPRLRAPGPRGFGRPPLMRGAPRRLLAPRFSPM